MAAEQKPARAKKTTSRAASGTSKTKSRPRKPAAKRPPARRRTTTPPVAPPVAPPQTVAESVQRDLDAIRQRDPALADSALAMTALALAREIDSGGNSATSKSMCSRELRELMLKLRELAPEAPKGDRIDELGARRAARVRSRSAAAANQ